MTAAALKRSLPLFLILVAFTPKAASAIESARHATPYPAPRSPRDSTPPRWFQSPQAGDELWSGQFALPAIDGFVSCAVMFRGELVIGGRFSQAGGTPARNVALWDGTQWLPLGGGLDNDVLSLAVFQDQLIVGGRFETAGTVHAIGVAEWDGTAWHAMGSGLEIPLQDPPAETSAFIEYGNRLVAAGSFHKSGAQETNGVAEWDGGNWQPLGDGLGPDGAGRALAVWRDSLYVGGFFGTAGGAASSSIGMWDGSKWSGVGGGLTSTTSLPWVYSLAVFGDQLVAGGAFDYAGTVPAANIASWDGAQWNAMGSGAGWGVMALAVFNGKLVSSEKINGTNLGVWDGTSWSSGAPIPIGNASCLLPVNDGLIVGGDFQASRTQDGPIRGFSIAKWNGSDWIGFEPWGASMHGLTSYVGGYPFVQSLASYRGELVAGGFVDLAGDPSGWLHVGPVATWNGTRWQALGFLDAFGQTYSMLTAGDTLYAGGTLYGYSGAGYAMGLWRYTGGSWTMIDTLNAGILSLTMYHGDLYVGARRMGSPAPFSGGVYRWDGQQLVSIASFDPGVRAMTIHDDRLVVAGEFGSIGGIDAPGLASWDGNRWSPLPGNPPSPGDIVALASWNGGLVAGGRLGQVAGYPSVATLDGGSWRPIGDLSGSVTCLSVIEGNLFTGGWFYRPPAFEKTTILVWDGTDWKGLGSGVNGQVMALQEHGGSLYLGGAFSLAGGQSSFGIAQWSGLVPFSPPGVPRVAQLHAARPSPFRGSTTIPFTVPAPGQVRIVVYDIQGRKIAVLEDGGRVAGDFSVRWNGRDDSGRPAPSGLYFVRATMPGAGNLTRKVALVR